MINIEIVIDNSKCYLARSAVSAELLGICSHLRFEVPSRLVTAHSACGAPLEA
jgi:hypothetical protein